MNIGDPLYRYNEDIHEDMHITLGIYVYTVRKVTRCGVWVATKSASDYLVEKGWCKKRFINLSSNKKFAHPTKEAAMESFIARKRRQIAILEWQLQASKKALSLAEAVTP